MSLNYMLGWNHDSIKRYFVENPAYLGQELLVAEYYYGNPAFWLVTVVDPDVKPSRWIRVSQSFGWHTKNNLFCRSGKHQEEPTGKLCLLPYNEQIAQMIRTRKTNPVNCIRFQYEEWKSLDIFGPAEYGMKED